MKYLLDTNVLSEVTRKDPNRGLLQRLGEVAARDVATSAVCVASGVEHAWKLGEFRVGEPATELVLERVAGVMESERARLKRQPFSLYFRGPSSAIRAQQIYELRHPAFPEPLGIFLVPVGRASEGIQYEAVFT